MPSPFEATQQVLARLPHRWVCVTQIQKLGQSPGFHVRSYATEADACDKRDKVNNSGKWELSAFIVDKENPGDVLLSTECIISLIR